MMWPFIANMTQDQALDSIRQDLGGGIDGWLIIWAAIGVIVLIGLLALVNRLTVKRGTDKSINNPTKLVKEVSNALGLKSADMKKLRAMMEQTDGKTQAKNPLVLLLCPSVLARAMKKK